MATILPSPETAGTTETARRPRVQRIRHELVRREVTVLRSERLSPHVVAITFGGASLAGFVSLSFDDHLKFMVDDASGQPLRRDYTPRRFDAGRRELTIEFVVHGEADVTRVQSASDWALLARPGDRATLGGPRGSMVIAIDHDWHLLAGDLSALPAIHRRLEELPASARVQVVLLVPDVADRRLPASDAMVELEWVDSADALVQAIERLRLPAGEGHAWAAGEAAVMARVRQALVTRHGLPKEAMRVSAYWKPGAADFHETLDA